MSSFFFLGDAQKAASNVEEAGDEELENERLEGKDEVR